MDSTHTSNQASPFYITTLQIEDVHLPSKSPIPVPQVNSDHGAYISVPVNETYHMIICVHMSHMPVAHMLT